MTPAVVHGAIEQICVAVSGERHGGQPADHGVGIQALDDEHLVVWGRGRWNIFKEGMIIADSSDGNGDDG